MVVIGREHRVLGHLPRWSIIRTIRQQNVAEHTAMVMILVDRFNWFMFERDRGIFERHDTSPAAILRGALYHDLTEVLSGDIANPAKQAMFSAPGAKAHYHAWEAERMKERFPWYDEETNPFARRVIGLMDMLEADIFLLEEARLGNQEVNSIGTKMGRLVYDAAHQFKQDFGVPAYDFTRRVKDEIAQSCDMVVR